MLLSQTGGGARVYFVVETEQKMRVSISLQNSYFLNQEIFEGLSNMAGVRKVKAG